MDGFDGLLDSPQLQGWRAICEEHTPPQETQRWVVANILLPLAQQVELKSSEQAAAGEAELVTDRANLAMWSATMQMIADGELSMHVDRFADCLNELLACLDDQQGELADAWGETE